MKIIFCETANASIELSNRELVLLSNAINESFGAIESWEYHTKMGVKEGEARVLLKEIGQLLKQMK